MQVRARQAPLPIGCLGVAVALALFGLPVAIPLIGDAVEEIRIHRSYVAVPCTVVSARLDVSESSQQSDIPSKRGRRVSYHPRFFLQFVADGRPVLARGFSSRNYEQDLSGDAAREAMAMFPAGSAQSCYYDPSNPKRAVLVREWGDRRRYLLLIPTGGAILVALLIGVMYAHERFFSAK